jgi:glutathionyl-hydroquinone reductase
MPLKPFLPQSTRASWRIVSSHCTQSSTLVQGHRSFHQQASTGVLGLTSSATPAKNLSTTETLYNLRIQRMSSNQRDVSHLADISKSKMADDGSFIRKPSTFRDVIEKGGKYEPEKGEFDFMDL